MKSTLLRSTHVLPGVELRGTPVSGGTVSGPARIILAAQDVQRVRRGDVVVCEIATGDIAMLSGIASAIVAECGGSLSNPATVAREAGLPAVFGVSSATRLLIDGQRVTVDGSRGLVIAS